MIKNYVWKIALNINGSDIKSYSNRQLVFTKCSEYQNCLLVFWKYSNVAWINLIINLIVMEVDLLISSKMFDYLFMFQNIFPRDLSSPNLKLN